MVRFLPHAEERDAHMQSPAAGMQHHLPLRQLICDSTGRGFGTVKRVYVVPGEVNTRV